MPRPKGSAELIEARRRQALRLLDEGYTLNEVGRMLDCAASSVMRWRDAREREGDAGLRVRFSSGRPATLSEAQRQRLVKRLLKGALANGFATELWTSARVGALIERHFQVQFHRSHVAPACCMSWGSAARSPNAALWSAMRRGSSTGSAATGRE